MRTRSRGRPPARCSPTMMPRKHVSRYNSGFASYLPTRPSTAACGRAGSSRARRRVVGAAGAAGADGGGAAVLVAPPGAGASAAPRSRRRRPRASRSRGRSPRRPTTSACAARRGWRTRSGACSRAAGGDVGGYGAHAASIGSSMSTASRAFEPTGARCSPAGSSKMRAKHGEHRHRVVETSTKYDETLPPAHAAVGPPVDHQRVTVVARKFHHRWSAPRSRKKLDAVGGAEADVDGARGRGGGEQCDHPRRQERRAGAAGKGKSASVTQPENRARRRTSPGSPRSWSWTAPLAAATAMSEPHEAAITTFLRVRPCKRSSGYFQHGAET